MRTHTAADPESAVIQRPPRPEARFLPGAAGGEPGAPRADGLPGCAETDRPQRAPTRPPRPKTVVRWRRGRGPAKPGGGPENAKSGGTAFQRPRGQALTRVFACADRSSEPLADSPPAATASTSLHLPTVLLNARFLDTGQSRESRQRRLGMPEAGRGASPPPAIPKPAPADRGAPPSPQEGGLSLKRGPAGRAAGVQEGG